MIDAWRRTRLFETAPFWPATVTGALWPMMFLQRLCFTVSFIPLYLITCSAFNSVNLFFSSFKGSVCFIGDAWESQSGRLKQTWYGIVFPKVQRNDATAITSVSKSIAVTRSQPTSALNRFDSEVNRTAVCSVKMLRTRRFCYNGLGLKLLQTLLRSSLNKMNSMNNQYYGGFWAKQRCATETLCRRYEKRLARPLSSVFPEQFHGFPRNW